MTLRQKIVLMHLHEYRKIHLTSILFIQILFLVFKLKIANKSYDVLILFIVHYSNLSNLLNT